MACQRLSENVTARFIGCLMIHARHPIHERQTDIVYLSNEEAAALRDFLNSLPLDEVENNHG